MVFISKSLSLSLFLSFLSLSLSPFHDHILFLSHTHTCIHLFFHFLPLIYQGSRNDRTATNFFGSLSLHLTHTHFFSHILFFTLSFCLIPLNSLSLSFFVFLSPFSPPLLSLPYYILSTPSHSLPLLRHIKCHPTAISLSLSLSFHLSLSSLSSLRSLHTRNLRSPGCACVSVQNWIKTGENSQMDFFEIWNYFWTYF